jgi:hypothetical protein
VRNSSLIKGSQLHLHKKANKPDMAQSFTKSILWIRN